MSSGMNVKQIIDAQWRYVLTLFSLSYFLTWFSFAVLWYLIAYTHGDITYDLVTGHRLNEGRPACVEGCKSFADFYLFSVETQVSIGFGTKFPTEECPEAVFLIVIQVIIGIGIEGAMIGVVYAKMTKPSRHVTDMNFSKKAVICQRNSKLCLIFRTCDVKNSHVINTKVDAFWFEERVSLEGEKIKNVKHTLKLENSGSIFLIFPATVCHVIDEFDTPSLSAHQLEVVIDESNELSESSVTYYNENLNYIGHSVTENYEQLTMTEPTPGTSGLVRSQSEEYTTQLQNTYNERHANKWQNELVTQ